MFSHDDIYKQSKSYENSLPYEKKILHIDELCNEVELNYPQWGLSN